MDTLKKTTLFWDRDVNTIDPAKHCQFIIERVLQYGDVEDVRWAKGYYGDEALREVVVKNHILDHKSQNFWCVYFNIDPALCFQNQSIKKQGAFSQR